MPIPPLPDVTTSQLKPGQWYLLWLQADRGGDSGYVAAQLCERADGGRDFVLHRQDPHCGGVEFDGFCYPGTLRSSPDRIYGPIPVPG